MVIVSTDLFVCGFGYGTGKVHVPFRKVLLINIIGSIMIGVGLFAGYFIGNLICEAVANWVAFGVLFGLGTLKLIQWLFTRKKDSADQIRLITWRETLLLAVALSLDGLAVGIGSTVGDWGLAFIITVLAFSVITDPLVFWLGQRIGRKVAKRVRLDLSWLSGVLLIGLAVIGFFI